MGEGEWGRCKFCHALTYKGHIVSQGCWLEGDGCSSPCLLSPLGRDQLSFCCCHGDLCNLNPQPAPLLKCLNTRRKARGPWAEDRPLLVGLGVSALLDLERG